MGIIVVPTFVVSSLSSHSVSERSHQQPGTRPGPLLGKCEGGWGVIVIVVMYLKFTCKPREAARCRRVSPLPFALRLWVAYILSLGFGGLLSSLGFQLILHEGEVGLRYTHNPLVSECLVGTWSRSSGQSLGPQPGLPLVVLLGEYTGSAG